MFQLFVNSLDVYLEAFVVVKFEFAALTFVIFHFLMATFHVIFQTREKSETRRAFLTLVRSYAFVNLADVTFKVVLQSKIYTADFT